MDLWDWPGDKLSIFSLVNTLLCSTYHLLYLFSKSVCIPPLDAVIVLLKLTDDGFIQYKLNTTLFKTTLLQELSQFIPIPQSRLQSLTAMEYNSQSSSTPPGLYFELTISAQASGNDTDIMTSMDAANYLSTLISNLPLTILQYGNTTRFLDPAVPAPLQGELLK
ncbi:LOW QUALITY PROTEIN: hypothetical protein BC937DRAFT_91454 [Endogone sp. FLAS-F59071]|nr:LOW QUALITY PROTEIN: hypothetical protein BC937DRAFT_91454 [Endogone sp. FLAS-F59071]|eukprot:RUS16240.1 LOW QUALITY PROTEIN: hypothetical protein BC937DRAFT_91454 [Endogone sp. FLAS-F59071]